MRQNRRSVRDFAAELENYIDRLSLHNKATLLQIFIWKLNKDLVGKVSMAQPKTLLSTIGIVEDLELAIRFAHLPPVKGATATFSGRDTQASGGQQMQWRGGR